MKKVYVILGKFKQLYIRKIVLRIGPVNILNYDKQSESGIFENVIKRTRNRRKVYDSKLKIKTQKSLFIRSTCMRL